MTAALPKSIRLRTLNALLASMTGTAPQLRGDVDAVLRVFESDDQTDPRLSAADLAAAAAQIFRLLSPDRPTPVIAVLDHRAEPFDALWAPERVEAALATAGEAADVLFWVVGLQDQYLAGSRVRSGRARAAYDEAVDTVQGLVARQAGRRRVTVVIL
ncbi:MAG: hypothetical protein RL303_24 [Verrucomicrobiota bacterium]